MPPITDLIKAAKTIEDLELFMKPDIINHGRNLFMIIDQYEKIKNNQNKIRIQFTDDQYGKAASRLNLPKFAYDGDAGFDLPVVLDQEHQKDGFEIFPGDRAMLHTGMIIEYPVGYWARIIHRSSTERKSRLRIIEGIIDDYRGEIICQAHNMNTFPIRITHGQKIAQMILCKTCNFQIEVASTLRPSMRGASGFGSTGS